MDVLRIPAGTIKKNQGCSIMRYDFCSGDIIGVYDAEDATEPDHLLKVAEQFASAGQNTTCLQCGLIYFSANTRFISRCFVNEYTSCFCTFLPKLLKLGVLIPPGRTTLFFGVLF